MREGRKERVVASSSVDRGCELSKGVKGGPSVGGRAAAFHPKRNFSVLMLQASTRAEANGFLDPSLKLRGRNLYFP